MQRSIATQGVLGSGLCATVHDVVHSEQDLVLKVYHDLGNVRALLCELAFFSSTADLFSRVAWLRPRQIGWIAGAHGRRGALLFPKAACGPLQCAHGPALLQAAAGLLAIHAAGWVHGDVAARNCLVDHGGKVLWTDFGAARRAHADSIARDWRDFASMIVRLLARRDTSQSEPALLSGGGTGGTAGSLTCDALSSTSHWTQALYAAAAEGDGDAVRALVGASDVRMPRSFQPPAERPPQELHVWDVQWFGAPPLWPTTLFMTSEYVRLRRLVWTRVGHPARRVLVRALHTFDWLMSSRQVPTTTWPEVVAALLYMAAVVDADGVGAHSDDAWFDRFLGHPSPLLSRSERAWRRHILWRVLDHLGGAPCLPGGDLLDRGASGTVFWAEYAPVPSATARSIGAWIAWADR